MVKKNGGRRRACAAKLVCTAAVRVLRTLPRVVHSGGHTLRSFHRKNRKKKMSFINHQALLARTQVIYSILINNCFPTNFILYIIRS